MQEGDADNEDSSHMHLLRMETGTGETVSLNR
jgi:hypothetical protein